MFPKLFHKLIIFLDALFTLKPFNFFYYFLRETISTFILSSLFDLVTSSLPFCGCLYNARVVFLKTFQKTHFLYEDLGVVTSTVMVLKASGLCPSYFWRRRRQFLSQNAYKQSKEDKKTGQNKRKRSKMQEEELCWQSQPVPGR